MSPAKPRSRFSIRRKVVLSFALVLTMLGIIGYVSLRSTRAFIRNAELVAQTRKVMETEERTLRHLMEMEAGRRGFLIKGDENLLRGYTDAQGEVIRNFNTLKVDTADAPQQTLKLNRLLRLIQTSFKLQREEIEARRTLKGDEAVALFAKGETERVTREIQKLLADFNNEQQALLTERAEFTGRVGKATTATILAGGIFTFLALVWACVLILRDIAARRRAEAALAAEHNLLRSIINTIPDHVFVKDLTGRFILDNEAHRSAISCSGEGVEGRTVFDYFPEEDASRYHDDDRFVIETGERILKREDAVVGPDGREIWLQTTKVPLRDPGGRIIGLVGIAANISARKADEEQLRRFAGQLERSNSELKNFASVASHDLQEPLRKIQAFGGRLRAKCAEALGVQGMDYLTRMEGAAQRMQVLIQDLLKLSRVTSRALPFVDCALRDIALGVVSDLEVAIEQKNARVQIGDLPVIQGDPVQMQQLFQNLISNALKFQRPGEVPVVTVTSRIYTPMEPLITGATSGAALCEIVVQDNGIGFEACFAEQIFVVFQRLHTRSEYEGTGIGLAVCRKITDRHGGTIVAHSGPSGGATFTITLPIKQLASTTHE
ncbi:MAG: CHASE3 domain-containing protein [Chthoniobacter sp.]|nr:CHASE3 domain-containing protein [Chthoniobacter sp.]